MVIHRGEIWWADLPEPGGSEPGYRRPVLVVQSDAFNRSRIATVVVAAITSNLSRAGAAGNVLISSRESGLPRDSVVNVSQILAIDKERFVERVARLSLRSQALVDAGLRMVLALG